MPLLETLAVAFDRFEDEVVKFADNVSTLQQLRTLDLFSRSSLGDILFDSGALAPPSLTRLTFNGIFCYLPVVRAPKLELLVFSVLHVSDGEEHDSSSSGSEDEDEASRQRRPRPRNKRATKCGMRFLSARNHNS